MIINENASYSMYELMPIVEECVKKGQDVRLMVSGISMTPILHNRKDSVVLSKADKFSKYDIVLHRRKNGQYILHRIVGKKNGAFFVAGDFETKKEYPVYEDMIIAKVTSFYRNGKKYSPNDFTIKMYSRIWVAIFPIRHWVLYILNVARRLLHA